MEFISSLIPLFVIISIVISIVSKAKQAQNKTSVKKPTQAQSAGSQSRGLSLQEMIRQQIEEQRNAASPTGIPPAAAKPEPKRAPEPVFDRTLTSIPKMRYNEGDTLNRSTLEGTPVEMQRHSHNAHPGGSYNEGDPLDRYSLESSPILDYEDKFDLDVAASASRRGKSTAKKKPQNTKSGPVKLKFDQNGIVNGIIMSRYSLKEAAKGR